jgi:hypothetical protein
MNIDMTDILSLLHPQIDLAMDNIDSGGYYPSANDLSLNSQTKFVMSRINSPLISASMSLSVYCTEWEFLNFSIEIAAYIS